MVLLALYSSTHGFDHNVVPACAPEEDVCVFDWKIDYIETMIYFEEQGGGGEQLWLGMEAYSEGLDVTSIFRSTLLRVTMQ